MKKYILLTFILCFASLNAQHKIKTSTETLSYYNGITGQDQIIQEYKITNNSSEDYLTWISLDIIKNKSDKEIIHDYFKQIKGDFNLTQMMYESVRSVNKSTMLVLKNLPQTAHHRCAILWEFTYHRVAR